MTFEDVEDGEPTREPPIERGPCGKKVYLSVKMARWACHKTGARLRVYWCDDCGAYHTTNGEKR